MPWPIITPSGTRQNTTPHINTHPDDHNKIKQALDDLAAVAPKNGHVLKWGGGPFTASRVWTIGPNLPTFPYAGVVIFTAAAAGGYGTEAIDLLLDVYTNAIPAQAGGGFTVAASPGFSGYNDPTVNPGISPFKRIPAAVWGNLSSASVISPVAAGGRPDFYARVTKGAVGSNFYVDGYAWVEYLPGVSIPTTQLQPS